MQFPITKDLRIVQGPEKIHANVKEIKNEWELKMVWCLDTKRGSVLQGSTSPGNIQGCGADRAHIAPLIQVSRAPRWVQLRG